MYESGAFAKEAKEEAGHCLPAGGGVNVPELR